MSNIKKHLSTNNKVKGALERIEQLENDFPNLVEAMNSVLNQMSAKTTAVEEILEAVVREIGSEKIADLIVTIRKEKMAAEVAQAKAAIEKALAEGSIEPAEMVSERSLIVGKEVDKDGKQVGPEQVQLPYFQVKPEFQDKLLGQGVGYKMETSTGGTFEVLGIYNVVERKIIQPSAEEVATLTAENQQS